MDEVLFCHKKKGRLPFATTWMDFKGIILSEISHRKPNSVWSHLYVESTKNELMEIESKLVVATGRGMGESDQRMQTSTYKKKNSGNGDYS